MWSQLRDISIRVDEDAERGTPLNVSQYYALDDVHATANQEKGESSRVTKGTLQGFNENGRAQRNFGVPVSHQMATSILM
jgi:hypothetical protein